jgi:hypothetical protein
VLSHSDGGMRLNNLCRPGFDPVPALYAVQAGLLREYAL